MRDAFSKSAVYVNLGRREVAGISFSDNAHIDMAFGMIEGQPLVHAEGLFSRNVGRDFALVVTTKPTTTQVLAREHTIQDIVRERDIAVIAVSGGGFTLYNPANIARMTTALAATGWEYFQDANSTRVYHQSSSLPKDLKVLVEAMGVRHFVLTPDAPVINEKTARQLRTLRPGLRV